MAYTEYKFKQWERLSDVASQYDTTIDEIMRINNVQPPYPQLISQLPDYVIWNGYLTVPVNTNGNQSFETYWNTAYNSLGIEYVNAKKMEEFELSNLYNYRNEDYFFNNTRMPGRNVPCCWITVGGVGFVFPCAPESVSDSNQASYSSVNILGRSEPFQYYTGSGPRTVSTAFKMHTDMCDDVSYIYKITKIVESACYPDYGNNIAATRCHLHLVNNIDITGIITSVNTQYSGPIIMDEPWDEGEYAVIDLSFSVTEVTGTPFSRSQIRNMGGVR
jgi:hypothetical protein